jgi:type VI protein secretion system component VasF
VVSKKQRRARLARAGRLRREARRVRREARRRRLRVVAAGLAALVAAAVLLTWILMHDADQVASAPLPDDYDAGSAAPASDPETETRRGTP